MLKQSLILILALGFLFPSCKEQVSADNSITNTKPDTETQVKSTTKYDPKTLIDASSLNGKSASDLRLMRNEIFAMHGYKFKDTKLGEHYAKMGYEASSSDVTAKLSELDKQNIEIIRAQERAVKNGDAPVKLSTKDIEFKEGIPNDFKEFLDRYLTAAFNKDKAALKTMSLDESTTGGYGYDLAHKEVSDEDQDVEYYVSEAEELASEVCDAGELGPDSNAPVYIFSISWISKHPDADREGSYAGFYFFKSKAGYKLLCTLMAG